MRSILLGPSAIRPARRVGNIVCCGAVPGTTIRGARARRTVSGALRRTVATSSAFGVPGIDFPFFFFPFPLFLLADGKSARSDGSRAEFFSLRRHSRERVLREDLLPQRPGVAMRGVSVPGLKPGGNVLPFNLAPLILPLHSQNPAAEADHVTPSQPSAIRQDPPAEERDAIGGPVDPA